MIEIEKWISMDIIYTHEKNFRYTPGIGGNTAHRFIEISWYGQKALTYMGTKFFKTFV